MQLRIAPDFWLLPKKLPDPNRQSAMKVADPFMPLPRALIVEVGVTDEDFGVELHLAPFGRGQSIASGIPN